MIISFTPATHQSRLFGERKIFLANFQLLATFDIVDGDHDDNEYDDNDNANHSDDNANHSDDNYDSGPPCSQISAYPPLPEKVLP